MSGKGLCSKIIEKRWRYARRATVKYTEKTDFVSLRHYGEPCASRGARTVREGASTRRLPHDTYNTGESRGRETSHSLNYQKLGKALMSQDELAVMDGGKCILQLRGVRPFLSDKYDITQHPNYKYTADADPKNAFDIEGYLKARLKLKPNQVCDVYEIDAAAGE